MYERLATYKDSKIYILGHDNADVDAITSAILLSRVLNSVGYNTQPVSLDSSIDNETSKLLKFADLKIDAKTFLISEEEIHNQNVILVDHHDTSYPVNVLGCIDHHPTQQKYTYPYYFNQNSCATAKHIYDLGQSIYNFSPEEMKQICFAMLVDTNGGKSTKTIAAEIQFVKEYCSNYGFSYDSLYTAAICLNDIYAPIESWVRHGEKENCFYGYKMKSSYIQINWVNAKIINKALLKLQEYCKQEQLAQWTFLVFDMIHDVTYVYIIKDSEIQEYIHDAILSRGKDVTPRIEAYYKERS